jgi:hypothetical protein
MRAISYRLIERQEIDFLYRSVFRGRHDSWSDETDAGDEFWVRGCDFYRKDGAGVVADYVHFGREETEKMENLHEDLRAHICAAKDGTLVLISGCIEFKSIAIGISRISIING